jgi:dolichol-phosphate mannosyltransferase
MTSSSVNFLNAKTTYISDINDKKSQSVELSLVIPTYNEIDNVKELVINIVSILDYLLPEQYEIIIVDDNSPDQTGKLVKSLISEYSQLRIISRAEKQGLASAVVEGWQHSRGKILGVMDGDLQHSPETLRKLWQAIENGADLAIASRYVKGSKVESHHFFRCLLSHIAKLLAIIVLPKKLRHISDPMSGYFLVRRTILNDQIFNSLGYKILLEIVVICSIKQATEVSFYFQKRINGKTKLSIKQCSEFLFHLSKIFYFNLFKSKDI